MPLLLLQNDSLIQNLSFKDNNIHFAQWFSFESNTLRLNQHLKQLTIKLRNAHDLFILIKNLSVLEYLNATVRGVRRTDPYDYFHIETDLESASLSPFLKNLIFESMNFTYSNLLLLLKAFQQSIELLALNVLISESVDGSIIESTIVSNLPKLKQFQFIFRINANANENGNFDTDLDNLISTFCATPYWQNHAVLCYHARYFPRINILSLPLRLKESDSITGGITNYRSNIKIPLNLNNVKTIFLHLTAIKLELLVFIQERFSKLKKLIISWYTCTLDEQVIKEQIKNKLTSVTILKYYGSTYNFDYINFLMFIPNIRCFIVQSSAIDAINECAHENSQVAFICEQINDLHIIEDDGDYDKDETKITFRNARISSKEI